MVSISKGAGPFPPHADGVDLHADGMNRLGGLHRRHLAGVVTAIGEKNEDLRLPGHVFQAFAGDGDGRADGRPVAGHADFHLLDQSEEEALVESEGRLGEGLVTEDDEADAVVPALFNELADHLLDRREPRHRIVVDLEIQRPHRPRGIEGEHDVHPRGAHLARDVVKLRARRRQEKEDEGRRPQGRGNPRPKPRAAARQPGQRRSQGVSDRQPPPAEGKDEPPRHGGEEEEDSGIGEAEDHGFLPDPPLTGG